MVEGPGGFTGHFFHDPVSLMVYVDYKFVVQGLGGTLATIILPASGYLIELKLALQSELGCDVFTSKLLVGTHMIPDWMWELWLMAPLWMLVMPAACDILVNSLHLHVECAVPHTETRCIEQSILSAIDASRDQLARGYRRSEAIILTVVRRPAEVGRVLDVTLGLQTLERGTIHFSVEALVGDFILAYECHEDLMADGDVQRAVVVALPEKALGFIGGSQHPSAEVGGLGLDALAEDELQRIGRVDSHFPCCGVGSLCDEVCWLAARLAARADRAGCQHVWAHCCPEMRCDPSFAGFCCGHSDILANQDSFLQQWCHNTVFQMAVLSARPSMFVLLMRRLHGQIDLQVAMHHFNRMPRKPAANWPGPWPEGWLRCLPFVRLLVRDATDAYGLLSEAARADQEVAWGALKHKGCNNHLLAPPALRRNEDFWVEALCRRLIDYTDLPIEWQWDISFMVRVLRGPPLKLQCSLCIPEQWPFLDSEEFLMELMWACSDSDFDFWRYVDPRVLFLSPRSLQLWAVVVRTTS